MKISTWGNGLGRADGAGEAGAKIVFTGDWAAVGDFARPMLERPAAVYGDTLEVLKRADLRVSNLECALGGTAPTVKCGPNLKGESGHVEAFAAGGFELAILANNHVCDYGREGLANTCRLLDERGIAHCGAGMDLSGAWRPAVLSANGLKVGVAAFCAGQDLTDAGVDSFGVAGWHTDLAAGLIADLRRSCDAVVAVFHGGVEYLPYPPPIMRRTAFALVDAGADAVVCHHPHVPQGIELHNGVPVFYSLGNYIFSFRNDRFQTRRGYLVELGVSGDGLTGFEIHPVGVGPEGAHLLRGADKAEFLRLLDTLSEPLPERADEAWHAFLKYSWNHRLTPYPMADEVGVIADDPRRGAAIMLNRLTDPSHTAYRIEMAKRVVDGVIDDAPEEFYRMAVEFMEHKI